LTNSGTVFCAGADLREQSATASSRKPSTFDEVLIEIMDGPLPVIGRINGHAVAGGVGLAASCDISIAREDALFGFTEVRVGVIPAVISVVCLPKMRRSDALETFLTGRRFPGTEAAAVGLITRAVPGAELDAAVQAVVDDVCLGGPEALAAAKRLVFEVPQWTRDEAFRQTKERSAGFFASAEATEGMAAFREKRRPTWAVRD
jgi:methylglutaconyl-CoA hydratase